jgi:hypothetical protein
MDYLLSIEKKVTKHLYPNPNRYLNFFSSFDQNIAHIWGLFCMNLNKHSAKNKNINFGYKILCLILLKSKIEWLKNDIRFHPYKSGQHKRKKSFTFTDKSINQ